VLANVPTSRSIGRGDTPGTALEALPPAEREAFQMLRANLRFINVDKELHSVVVTSAASGDGKTTVALNLAKADASIGRKVLLIEADMRRPSIAKLLGISATDGLAHYLRDPASQLEDVAVSVPVTAGTNGSAALTMDVVVSGAIPENPSELINSKRMSELIADAESRYELVVIDTLPVGIVADAIPLMSDASAVIVSAGSRASRPRRCGRSSSASMRRRSGSSRTSPVAATRATATTESAAYGGLRARLVRRHLVDRSDLPAHDPQHVCLSCIRVAQQRSHPSQPGLSDLPARPGRCAHESCYVPALLPLTPSVQAE